MIKKNGKSQIRYVIRKSVVIYLVLLIFNICFFNIYVGGSYY